MIKRIPFNTPQDTSENYNTDISLRPCPFCGEIHKLEILRDIDFGTNVSTVCSGEVLLSAYSPSTVSAIVTFWNTRPVEDELRTKIIELEKQSLEMNRWHKSPEIPHLNKDYLVMLLDHPDWTDRIYFVGRLLYTGVDYRWDLEEWCPTISNTKWKEINNNRDENI